MLTWKTSQLGFPGERAWSSLKSGKIVTERTKFTHPENGQRLAGYANHSSRIVESSAFWVVAGTEHVCTILILGLPAIPFSCEYEQFLTSNERSPLGCSRGTASYLGSLHEQFTSP
jgi:hypothetical protein